MFELWCFYGLQLIKKDDSQHAAVMMAGRISDTSGQQSNGNERCGVLVTDRSGPTPRQTVGSDEPRSS